MKVLVWHWGRRGAGPLIAARLAAALNEIPGQTARLSLAAGAEILTQPGAPDCAWREPTYASPLGYLLRRLEGPLAAGRIRKLIEMERPDMAICAMPALLDQRMVKALRRAGIPYAVMVHDATAHLGETLSFRAVGQSRMLREARALFSLSRHVEADLRNAGFGAGRQTLVKLWLPPFSFGAGAPPPFQHGGLPRLLCFGRLLPYKGLDLLADALEMLGPDLPFALRVCGDGPKSRELVRLRAMQNVTVEHRWVPEAEMPGLIAWADAVVLPYREASQSGVAAAAVAEGRLVLATNVGGLPEQLSGVTGASLCEPDAGAIAAGLKNLFAAARGAPDAVQEPVNAAADWRAMAAAMLETLELVQGVEKPALTWVGGYWRGISPSILRGVGKKHRGMAEVGKSGEKPR